MKSATSSSPEEVTTWTTNQVVFATIFVVCVFLIFWLLYRLQTVILIFFVAMVLGTAIRPAVEWLYRRGISRTSGVILVYISIAILLTAFLAMVVPLLAEQTTQLSQQLPQFYVTARNWLIDSDNRLLRNIGARIPAQLQLLLNTNPSTERVLDQVTRSILYVNLLIKGILSTLAIFLLAYYWTQESNGVIRTILRLIPPHRKKEFLEFLDHIETKIGGYIRGQGILCLIIGVAAFLAYLLIGLPFALALGIFAGVMEMIPIFGPALGAVPALLVALSISPEKAIWVVIATILIQTAENMYLLPRVMKNSMGVNPIIILLSMVAFGSVFGFAGVLLALPLAAILQFVINRIVTSPDNLNSNAQPEVGDIQPLLYESEKLVRTLQGMPSNGSTPFQELPETAQFEIQTIVQELHEFITKLKDEDEML
ncbi:MAG TPA: AI-2E family transporter [Anaerolineales bacterium]|nr:AI-2E family transporter [Anaerolineales bacterium]